MVLPSDSQEIALRRWQVIEIEVMDGTRSRHASGHDATNNKGCASSAIVGFDMDTMTVTTRSGKKYKLTGLPGTSRIGKAAWKKWCAKNEIVSEQDVTKEYLNVEQLSTVGFKKFNDSVSQ